MVEDMVEIALVASASAATVAGGSGFRFCVMHAFASATTAIRRMPVAAAGKFRERLRIHAQEQPFAFLLGADASVELSRVLVPLERRPFETSGAIACGNRTNILQQSAAKSAMSKSWPDIQIFEEDSRPGGEGGKRAVVNREADDHAVKFRDHRLGRTIQAEEVLANSANRNRALVIEVFKSRQLSNEPAKNRGILERRQSDDQIGGRRWARMCVFSHGCWIFE